MDGRREKMHSVSRMAGTKETIVKNAAWLFAGSAGSRLLKGLVVIYAARVLGASGYGVFSYAMGLMGFFIFIKNIGVDSILTREIAKKTEEEPFYIATALWIEVGLLLVTAALMVGVAPFLSSVEEALPILPLVMLILVADDMRDFLIALFRGKEKMELEAAVTVASNALVALCGIVALLISKTPLAFAMGYAFAAILGACVAAGMARPFLRGLIKNAKKALILPILKSAWPLAISGFASLFLFNVDIVMLGWWRTAEEIGKYAASQRIVGILSILPGIIATAIFPAVSRFVHQKDVKRMEETARGALQATYLVTLPFIAGGFVVGNDLLGFLFGGEYIGAGGVLWILLLMTIASSPFAIFFNLLFAYDKQANAIWMTIVASGTNVALNALLIPAYGALGAAVATTTTAFLYMTLVWGFAEKISGVRVRPQLGKILAASAIMAGGSAIIKMSGLHVLGNVVLSGAVYAGMLYTMREKAFREIMGMIRKKA